MNQPWIVAVISTDYDLQDERQALISFIRGNGMKASAFETPDFPVKENAHSHDNCLTALDRADIAIVLINSRYGGKYYYDKEKSITEAEYDRLNIPKIVLVNKDIWNERGRYRKQLKESGLSMEEFDKSGQFKQDKVQSVDVIHFIDNIQNDYERTGRSNWINFWEDLKDLESKLPALFESQTVSIIHRILNAQVTEVKSRKTSTGNLISLGDVFERGYYVEQNYIEESGALSEGDSLSGKINNSLDKEFSCKILGEAGAGKTTLMAKSFLERAERKDKPYSVPFYVWLKESSISSSFSVDDYLAFCCEKYLKHDKYPFFSYAGFKFFFFLDGFDELSDKMNINDIEHLLSSEMFLFPIVITSRTQFAKRYMTSNDFSSKFTTSIRLKDWDEKEAREYIDRFCHIGKKGMELRDKIHTLITDNPTLHDILKKPLLITVLLFVIEQSRMQIPETIHSRTTLFEKCLEILAEREIETKIGKDLHKPAPKEVVLCWSYFAWYIYKTRLMKVNSVLIDKAREYVQKNLGIGLTKQISKAMYDAVFDTNDDTAFGAFHEQFLEYLVAYALIYACSSKIEPYPDFLCYVMKPEINRYFRAVFEEKNKDEQNLIINNINDLYYQCLGSEGKDDIRKRVHAVYHLTRLEYESRPQMITKMFNLEKNKSVLQSLYFGVIKTGDLGKEEEFYCLLLYDQEYSDANRGYHLAYYGDLISQDELPYHDDISYNWEGTLNAFRRHFDSLNLSHFWLRRIEIITIKQFIEFRGNVGPLTDDILSELENAVQNMNISGADEYKRVTETAFMELKNLFIGMKNQ